MMEANANTGKIVMMGEVGEAEYLAAFGEAARAFANTALYHLMQ